MKRILMIHIYLCLYGCGWASPEGFVRVAVVDEEGKRLEGCQIIVSFEENGNYIRKTGLSKTNVFFEARAPASVPRCTVIATKEGYYKSRKTKMFTGRDRANSRYEPWGELRTIVLRRILDPVRGKEVDRDQGKPRKFPVYEEKIGFDLLEGDWVAPHGKGKVTDFRFLISRDSETKIECYQVTFPRQGDGIQEYFFTSPTRESSFDWPHQAPLKGYKATLKKKTIWGGDKSRLPDFEDFLDYEILRKKPQNYIFRIRTEYDEEGNIKSAYYGRINGDIIDLRYHNHEKLKYWINTDPTSRSLESIDLVEAEKRARSR